VIAYANAPKTVVTGNGHELSRNGLGVNRADGHLFVDFGSYVAEYGPATEGNPLLTKSIGAGFLIGSKHITIDAANNRLYASDAPNNSTVQVYELTAPHNLLLNVTGSSTPANKFFSTSGNISIATEESTGNFFVDDLEGKGIIYEYSKDGTLISSIKPRGFKYVFPSQIESDNGPNSPNEGTLYVPSGEGAGNTYAFVPKIVGAPTIESVTVKNVAATEAELTASVIPNTPGPEYVVEAVSQQQFEAEGGFAGATVAARGLLPASKESVPLSAPLSGLAPGTSYRVRLTVENEAGRDSAEVGFATVEEPGATNCPNEAARVGRSADLPDCRAYELVTPANTGGRSPLGVGNNFAGPILGTQSVTEDGSSVAFLVIGGVLPGLEGAGNFNGDEYLAVRGDAGWTTQSIAMNGAQSAAPLPGALSPDHLFEAVEADPPGSLALEQHSTTYLRYPDGRFYPLGRGSLGTQLEARMLLLANGGSHVVFASPQSSVARQLEPNAPPNGTIAIYDRPVSEEVTHVVSLLPGDVTPGAGQDARFLGASADGSAVAFRLVSGGTTFSDIYVRLNNVVTVDAAPSTSTFEGLSANGRYLFYLDEGNLSRFDTAREETVPITSGSNATVVNVAPDGSAVFFLSSLDLTPGASNPVGREASEEAGFENLYVWRDGALNYVATVTERDVKGESAGVNSDPGYGLGLWNLEQDNGKFAKDPSRATADGGTFVFESRADITGFDSAGNSEIYRYGDDGSSLICISCAPSNEVPTGSAHLQTVLGGALEVPIGEWAQMQNMAPGGNRVFFQSEEPLVQSDTNGLQDVYEWESQGTGSCVRTGGCISLISSGHSSAPAYFFGASRSGDDAFIITSDLLVGADTDPTLSVYDARSFGGSAPSAPTNCLAEGCRGQSTEPPAQLAPASTATGPSGNVKPASKCRKGTRRKKQHGKSRCVTKRHLPAHKKAKHARRKGGIK
jgi:hypothetical protein